MAIKNPTSPSVPPPPPPAAPGAAPALSFLASPAAIGAAVEAARVARGLTQADLAARARVSRRFVVNLENGKAGSHLGKTLTVMMSAGLVGVAVPVEAMQAALA